MVSWRTKELKLAADGVVEFLAVKKSLERRGASFLKVETDTWRIQVPIHLVCRPFFDFLEEQDCIADIGPIKVLGLPE